jgi:hypothetical protein
MPAQTTAVQPIGARLRPGQVPYLQEAAESARVNLQRAVDFVILHEPYTVSGPSPAAALNEPTVLFTVGAWERFVADLGVIARAKPWQGSGRHESSLAGAYLIRPRNTDEAAGPDQTVPGDAARVLAGMLGDTGPLGRLRMRVVYDWRGAAPRFADHTGVGLRARDYHRPVNPGEPWENLTTGEVVYQAIKLRSALAHRSLPRMGDPPSPAGNGAKPKPEASHWLNLPGQLFWLSDKNDGLSVQAGCARGVLALFIQLIDQVVVMLAGTLTEPENRAAVLRYRLPEEWFGATYPAACRRGLEQDVQLWRGKKLRRLEIEHFWQADT